MSTDYPRRTFAAVTAVIQPIVFSWIATALVAILCYTVTASSPALSAVTWQDSARLGTSLWLLAFGGPLEIGGATIGMMPLLVSAVFGFAIYRWMRRYEITGWLDIGISGLAAFLVTTLIGLIGLPGSIPALGGLGAAVITVICGLLARPKPPWLSRAWAITWPVMLALSGLAIGALAVSLVTGWDRVQEIQNYYLLGGLSTVVFAIAQLLFLPNVLIWALAYVSGVGFAVGEGTAFSPFGVSAAPLPALPILGALPTPDLTLPWIIALPIACGIGIGLWRTKPSLKESARDGGIAFLIILISTALVGALASGGIGPGRMTAVGIVPPLFGIVLAAEAGGGLLLGLLFRPTVEKIRESRSKDDSLPE
ncbi:MAG: cell division protein PerM [Ancrocorticia sp.]|uniref:cell division protein PerM n=1 Tax=Ancrocorticia sp. TaxID=2593684 RepID=UPI003F8EAE58